MTDRDVYRALRALFLADSGGGGLVSLVGVKQFVSSDEPDRPSVNPKILVTTRLDDLGGWYAAQTELLVVTDDRDLIGPGSTPEASAVMDAIVDRLRAVYIGVAPTLSGFTFRKGVEIAPFTPASVNEPHAVGRAVTVGHLCGLASADIPYAGGEGSVDLPLVDGPVLGWAVDERVVRETTDLTEYGKVYPRHTLGDSVFTGWIDLGVGASQPPPAGTVIEDAVFRRQAGSPGITSDIEVRGHTWSARRQGSGAPQTYRLYFVVNDDESGFRP